MERRQDIALGLIFVGLGIAAAWMATSYSGAGGTYPMVLGVILTLLGGTVALRAVRKGANKARLLVDAPVKMITAVVIAAIYVTLVVPLGFYTSSFLLMLALPIALGFRQGIYALIVALVFMTVVYLVFSVLLEKPLPSEALAPLFGLGV
ncbi:MULTISPECIES: tripartite tricarboxylate transporter TctB family protein [Pacificibacter]|uniref:tripartite tricarboxylate transporter TctB family protein n=1 Tax=Pacificibacter TaxID=1042323 RepID=UPI001C099060|nr:MULTISPECIES: tripartite tricarboxylate transporter TctB family protein [Pacificibacter]MBU2936560.1 tripartite tricarboxylate transporter TctB family protein [Pacificibacter marinus]MDO6614638.1 tripartite tricarboxylate transporter TctB family protein [Pacificibacter sp. 1_MG-2023]